MHYQWLPSVANQMFRSHQMRGESVANARYGTLTESIRYSTL